MSSTLQPIVGALQEIKALFEEAKQKNEFEFVLTLLNYRGMGPSEATSNLPEWFDAIEFYKSLYFQLEEKEKTRIGTLLYSTFFENADFYNIVGSFCQICLGYRGSPYLFWKTKKLERLLGTGEKIRLIMERLNDYNKQDIIKFFIQNHYEEIRNTFFHSGYSLSEGEYCLHDTGPINIGGVLQSNFNVVTFLYPRIENVISFFNDFKKLYFEYFNSYQQDKVIWGLFPSPTAITILGSESGLKGFNVKNTAQFYGQWVDAGIYYMEDYKMWAGRNLMMIFPNVEDIEIDERLQRYEGKDDIKLSDSEFFNLVDKVNERKSLAEIKRVVILLIKFGDTRYEKWHTEQNPKKKRDLQKNALPFYKRAIGINRDLDLKQVGERIKELEIQESSL